MRLPLPGVTVWSTGEALQEMVSEGNQKVPPGIMKARSYPAKSFGKIVIM